MHFVLRCSDRCDNNFWLGWGFALVTGTWLHPSKLPLVKIVRFIYMWAHEDVTIERCLRLNGMSKNATVDLCNYMREMAAEAMQAEYWPEQIGGEGSRRQKSNFKGNSHFTGEVVEIDETLYVRRKYNVGRRVTQQWVFGGIQRSNGSCFLVPVDKRDAETLLNIIELWVKPKTTIITDSWKAYRTEELKSMNYRHEKVEQTT